MPRIAPLRYCTTCNQWFGVLRWTRLSEITTLPIPKDVFSLCGACFEKVPNVEVLKKLESRWTKVWSSPRVDK